MSARSLHAVETIVLLLHRDGWVFGLASIVGSHRLLLLGSSFGEVLGLSWVLILRLLDKHETI